ncbi:TonB-dependent receptor [Dasania marina]|uniref:TonB-dependent receptor n=1 Tax=Dasania marina TaxID=471499 RepID=UPI0030DC9DE1|tara:strand:+ start:11253 stop:13568 length:2316 start_codon:yes stop_codon:yes gene_type:complete
MNFMLIQRKLDPLSKAINLNATMVSRVGVAALVASSGLLTEQALAQGESFALEEVVVTARKQTESLQDIPTSIQAFGNKKLEQLNVNNFDDYVALAPAMSAVSLGPGNSQVYMRGVSDGSSGIGAGAGASPSVAIYLDEQPVTAIGRNLDVHIYDIERIEVLAGPQGTLYGASSQSGTLRIITNKPNIEEFEGGIDLGYSTTSNGDPSNSVEGYINAPIVEGKAAIRLVGWRQDDGGYIDNVAQTKTYNNGAPVTVDNSPYVEENFNDSVNSGVRVALKVNLSDTWSLSLGHLSQKLESNGVFDHDPDDIGDLKVARFFEDSNTDKFGQSSLQLEGEIGGHDLLYAGSFLDREVDYELDYSSYSEGSPYIEYYVCDYDSGSTSYSLNCGDPRIQFTNDSQYNRESHELRVQSPQDQSLRYIAGVFYEKSEHDFEWVWAIPGIRPDKVIGQLDPNAYYLTDQKRVDEQVAVFGEFSYDLTDQLTATIGARYFDSESSVSGVQGSVFGFSDIDVETSEKDSLLKFNLTYQIDDNLMIYGTFSEGYRPGSANREPVPGQIAESYSSDIVTNYELGWKTMWLDNRLQFNGSAYMMTWEDMQLTRQDFSLSFFTFTENVSEAEIKGVEADLTFLATKDLLLTAAFSYNKAELSEDYQSTNTAAPEGTRLAFVPEFKGTLTARYSFDIASYLANVQFLYNYTSDSYNNLFPSQRQKQESYSFGNLSAGLESEAWSADIYIKNIWDERPDLYSNAIDFDSRVTTSRPRTVGIKYSYKF